MPLATIGLARSIPGIEVLPIWCTETSSSPKNVGDLGGLAVEEPGPLGIVRIQLDGTPSHSVSFPVIPAVINSSMRRLARLASPMGEELKP